MHHHCGAAARSRLPPTRGAKGSPRWTSAGIGCKMWKMHNQLCASLTDHVQRFNTYSVICCNAHSNCATVRRRRPWWLYAQDFAHKMSSVIKYPSLNKQQRAHRRSAPRAIQLLGKFLACLRCLRFAVSGGWGDAEVEYDLLSQSPKHQQKILLVCPRLLAVPRSISVFLKVLQVSTLEAIHRCRWSVRIVNKRGCKMFSLG